MVRKSHHLTTFGVRGPRNSRPERTTREGYDKAVLTHRGDIRIKMHSRMGLRSGLLRHSRSRPCNGGRKGSKCGGSETQTSTNGRPFKLSHTRKTRDVHIHPSFTTTRKLYNGEEYELEKVRYINNMAEDGNHRIWLYIY